MLKRLGFIVVLLGLFQMAKAQYKFSSDPAVFVQDINTMMTNTKNPAALQSGNAFGSTFTQFSVEQQKKVIETVQKLGKSKKAKAHPHFTDFLTALSAASSKKISNENFDTLLIMTNKIVENYDGKFLQSFFVTIRLFFEKDMLYTSAYNRLWPQVT